MLVKLNVINMRKSDSRHAAASVGHLTFYLQAWHSAILTGNFRLSDQSQQLFIVPSFCLSTVIHYGSPGQEKWEEEIGSQVLFQADRQEDPYPIG